MENHDWLYKIENGLSAHFKEENGQSRPGVHWMVKVLHATDGKEFNVMVKALYADDLSEKFRKDMEYQAHTTIQYLNERINSGWNPEFNQDHTIYISNPTTPENVKKKWFNWGK